MMNRLELVELARPIEYDPWLFRGGFLLTGRVHRSRSSPRPRTAGRGSVGCSASVRCTGWAPAATGSTSTTGRSTRSSASRASSSRCAQFLIGAADRGADHRAQLPAGRTAGAAGSFRRVVARRAAATHQGCAAAASAHRSCSCSAFAVLTGFATVSVATADVLCEGQVACDSEKGAGRRSPMRRRRPPCHRSTALAPPCRSRSRRCPATTVAADHPACAHHHARARSTCCRRTRSASR